MQNQSPITPQQSLVRLGLFLFLGGVALNELAKTDKNTINYVLYYCGKKVYHGICLNHRLEARIREHQAQGKRFDEYDYDSPRTAEDACRIEAFRVSRDQTKYNVHYR